MKPNRTTVTLTGNDACVIFKESGEIEFVGPEGEPGARVPPNVVVLLGVADHLMDSEFCEDMVDYMAEAANCQCPECQKANAPALLN